MSRHIKSVTLNDTVCIHCVHHKYHPVCRLVHHVRCLEESVHRKYTYHERPTKCVPIAFIMYIERLKKMDKNAKKLGISHFFEFCF